MGEAYNWVVSICLKFKILNILKCRREERPGPMCQMGNRWRLHLTPDSPTKTRLVIAGRTTWTSIDARRWREKTMSRVSTFKEFTTRCAPAPGLRSGTNKGRREDFQEKSKRAPFPKTDYANNMLALLLDSGIQSPWGNIKSMGNVAKIR